METPPLQLQVSCGTDKINATSVEILHGFRTRLAGSARLVRATIMDDAAPLVEARLPVLHQEASLSVPHQGDLTQH